MRMRVSLGHLTVHVYFQYCDLMRFTVLHNRHHKVSQGVPFFMHWKPGTILMRIRVRGHLVMSITRNHDSHYFTLLDNPRVVNGQINTERMLES